MKKKAILFIGGFIASIMLWLPIGVVIERHSNIVPPIDPEISMAEITEVVFNSFDFGISVDYDIENGTYNPLIRIDFEIHEGWFFYLWELSSLTNISKINWTVSISNHKIISFNDFGIDEVLLLFMSYNEFGNSTLHIILDGPWSGADFLSLNIEDVSNVFLLALIDKEVFTT